MRSDHLVVAARWWPVASAKQIPPTRDADHLTDRDLYDGQSDSAASNGKPPPELSGCIVRKTCDFVTVRQLWSSASYLAILIAIWLSWLPISRVGQGNASFIMIPVVAMCIAAFYFARKIRSLLLCLCTIAVYYVAMQAWLVPFAYPVAEEEWHAALLLCLAHMTLQAIAALVIRLSDASALK